MSSSTNSILISICLVFLFAFFSHHSQYMGQPCFSIMKLNFMPCIFLSKCLRKMLNKTEPNPAPLEA